MSSIKEIIKKNMVLIIILVTICASIGVYYYIDHVNDNEIYQSGLYSDEEIPYINKKYQENEYQPIEVTDRDMALKYYTYVLNHMLNEPETIYERLTEQERKRYGSLEEFKDMVKSITTVFTPGNRIMKYGVEQVNSIEKKYVVVDNENNSFTIIEKGVWDIEIEFNGKIKLEEN